MKRMKFLTVLISMVMLLSAASGLLLNVGAVDVAGDFTVYRTPGSYIPNADGSEKVVAPCPGYEYTDDGFSILAPSWKDCTPFYTIQTVEKKSLQDGVYMQFRVDDYSYAGDNGADHWLAFSIWNSQNLNPGSTKYGQGWIALMYPLTGDVYSHNSTESAFASAGKFNIETVKDAEGRALYDLEVTRNGSDYMITVNDVAVAGLDQVNAHLNSLDPNGDFYIGVTLYTGVSNGTGDLTVTKFGTSKADAETPKGSDAREPEANNLVIADIADPSTVPEGTPAMLWNAEKVSAVSGESNMTLTPMGDNSYRCEASEKTCEFRWVMPNSVSYDGADFPVFTMLIRGYDNDGGHFFYCAGDELVPSTSARLTWVSYADNCDILETETDEYVMVVLDLTDLWSGRIHQVVPGFAVDTSEDTEWDICYMAFFRTVDEATAYAYDYLDIDADAEETPTEALTEALTEAPAESVVDTSAEISTNVPAEETAQPSDTVSAEKTGCGAAIGISTAVLATAIAAGFVLRKRR